MCPPTRPSHTRLSSKLKGAEIIPSEGNFKKEERKKKSHNAVPNLVRSQWLAAAIQSHRGERWPREVGGRGGEREGAAHAARQPGGSPAGSHQELPDFGERAIPKGCDPETTQAPMTIAASGWTTSKAELLGRGQRPAEKGLSSPPP